MGNLDQNQPSKIFIKPLSQHSIKLGAAFHFLGKEVLECEPGGGEREKSKRVICLLHMVLKANNVW